MTDTATLPTAKLSTLADGVTMSTPSPLIRVLWHHNGGDEHIVAYIGFLDRELASKCFEYLCKEVGRYDRSTNAGICKPRQAKRIEDAAYEIKWHAPVPDLLAQFVAKDRARA